MNADLQCQCDLLSCIGKTEEDRLKLIECFGKLFRDIIVEFEKNLGRDPTCDDLIWVASQHLNRNIREMI